MIDTLKQSPRVRPRPTFSNPHGLYLPFKECSTVCTRHREESEVVPKGREQNWPSEGEIDFNDLPRWVPPLYVWLGTGLLKGCYQANIVI